MAPGNGFLSEQIKLYVLQATFKTLHYSHPGRGEVHPQEPNAVWDVQQMGQEHIRLGDKKQQKKKLIAIRKYLVKVQ